MMRKGKMNKLSILFLILALSLLAINCQTLVPTSRSVKADHRVMLAEERTKKAREAVEAAKQSGDFQQLVKAANIALKAAEENQKGLGETAKDVKKSEADIQKKNWLDYWKWVVGFWIGITLIVIIKFRKFFIGWVS